MNRLTRTIAVAGALSSAVLLAGCAGIFSGRHPVGNANVRGPAKSVDLQRYLGRWYEVARYEQGFQKDCDGVVATYSLRPDGRLDVLNSCRRPDGKIKNARGIAKIVDQATNAKLKVSFFGPFYGDYWVLDHADDYGWSIVGEASGRYLWLLSRKVAPSKASVDALIGRAAELGYDTSMLRMTKQP